MFSLLLYSDYPSKQFGQLGFTTSTLPPLKRMESRSMLSKLPLEIQHAIFRYLDIKDLISLSQVNRNFHDLIVYDNGYLTSSAVKNTNRMIELVDQNVYTTMIKYRSLQKSINSLARCELLSLKSMITPAVNQTPLDFGKISLAFVSEPSFSNDHVMRSNKNCLYASVQDHSRLITMDFDTRSLKVEPSYYCPNLSYTYNSGTSNMIVQSVTTAGHDFREAVVVIHNNVEIHKQCFPFDKCNPMTEGIFYIEPHIIYTNSENCIIYNAFDNGKLVANVDLPEEIQAYEHNTFVTQTHLWVITNDNNLLSIELENVFQNHIGIKNWTHVANLAPIDTNIRLECINRYYSNKIALTCEGDVMILIDLDTTATVKTFGFANDKLRWNNCQFSNLYLKGFGFWVVDELNNALFIRTLYLYALIEQYEQCNYNGFVPLSVFNIPFNSTGRLV